MLEEWTHLPRWVKFGSAALLFGYSTYWASRGVLWPWGFGIGALVFVMSFMKPLGPPRKKFKPAERSDATSHEGDALGRAGRTDQNPYRSKPDVREAAQLREAKPWRAARRPRPKPYWSLLLGAAIAAFAVLALSRFMR